MPLPPPEPSIDPSDFPLESRTRPQLCERLCRPIVFETPGRVVHPPSWLEHIPFAFWIVDVLRPSVFVELGTHSGNSYAAFAQAIQRLGLPSAAYAVDTWKGDSQAGFYDETVYLDWAAYHDRHFLSFSRLVRTTFADAADHFPDGSVDLLHIDGCHVYDVVAADFAGWRNKLSRRGVILFHDTNIRELDFGAWRLWEELKAQRLPSFEFLHGHGLGVLGVGTELPEPLRWLFSRSGEQPDEISDIRQFFSTVGSVISARFAAGQTVQRLEEEAARARAAEEASHAQAIAERDATIAEQTESARALQSVIDEQDGRLREYADRLSSASTELDALRTAVATAETSVADREQALEEVTVALQDLQVRHDEQKQVLEALHQRTVGRRAPANASEGEAVAVRGTLTGPSAIPRGFRGALITHARIWQTALKTPFALGILPALRQSWRPSSLRFAAHPRLLADARTVIASGLFDAAFYTGTYPDVAASRMNPLVHYLTIGGVEGRKPHPLFDGDYYLRHNPDVAASRVNPLLHYLRSGATLGLAPHALFDSGYYLACNHDVRNAGLEPLGHFLRFGVTEGRQPNALFDCAHYLRHNRDVAASGTNPLIHFATDGWREGRAPSALFDVQAYLAEYPDVVRAGINPLAHYLECGRSEGRQPPGMEAAGRVSDGAPPSLSAIVTLSVTPLKPVASRPTILCLSHVMPFPPRAGNEYRIYRLLCWLRERGYRIVPVIAPLPGDHIASEAVWTLADKFSNAVLCDRDGRVEYVLGDVPDVLGSLGGEVTRPVSLILDEQQVRGEHERELLQMDRAFCHDVLITVTTRLQEALGPHVLLAEYIWMSRILPLMKGNVLKVIDTIDVFSTKRDKVLRFGIEDLHVDEREEARRLQHADLIVAIQDDERQQLQRLLPDKRVITAGVDYDVVADPGTPSGRRILLVASGNPMNWKGLTDFLRFAWPQVKREVPDAELVVIGKVGESIEVEMPGVVRLANVGDLTPHYQSARVVINPAVAGTGLKIKTLEALGHLRPLVTWPSGTDGVPPELAALCQIVSDWYEFARRVSRLLAAPEPRLFSAEERATIVRLTSPQTVYAGITDALDALVAEHFGAAPQTWR